jgi:hypothetical protein
MMPIRLPSSSSCCSPWRRRYRWAALASGFLLAGCGTSEGPGAVADGLPASAALDGASAGNPPASEAASSDTALASAAQTPASREGGQTGGIGADLVTYTALGHDQAGPAGFSPAQAIAAFAGTYSAEFVYASGEHTTLHVDITPNGAAVAIGEDPTAPYVFQSWASHPENDSLSLGAEVSFVTDDGLFQEHGPYGLIVHSLESARTYAQLALSVLRGGYVDAAELRTLASSESDEPSAVWILPNVSLQSTGALHAMTGTLIGHLPDPEAEQPGDLAVVTIGSW